LMGVQPRIDCRAHGRVQQAENHAAMDPLGGVEMLRAHVQAHDATFFIQADQLQAQQLGKGAHAIVVNGVQSRISAHGYRYRFFRFLALANRLANVPPDCGPEPAPCLSARGCRGRLRSLAGALLRAPVAAPGWSPMRMVRLMRWRGISTSSTLTLTMSPALTTSRGSLTKLSPSMEICTRPSWCTPISTNAPKLATLLTT